MEVRIHCQMVEMSLLPLSKKISLTDCPIMYPLKQKDTCDYDPICNMSSGLMFYYIIMNIIRNKNLAHPIEENECLFTQIENHIIYMYRGVNSRPLLKK